MKYHTPRTHTTLFRVVSTIVFILLLFTTFNNGYATEDNLITNIISQLNSIIFGNQSNSLTTTNQSSADSLDTTCSTGTDPNPDIPPPPR